MKNNRVRLWVNPIAVGVVIMVFVGCAPTSIFHKYKIADDEATSILIDAKQRAILAVARLDHAQQGGSRKEASPELARRILVCAEPSPDALSIVSTSLNASAGMSIPSGVKGEPKIEKTLKEIAQTLGSRETTIQLLRDGLYRQCEAYLNGMIDADDYKELANRYVDAMVTLLAIERITPEPTKEPSSSEKESPNSGEQASSASTNDAMSALTSESAETEEDQLTSSKRIGTEVVKAVQEITRTFLIKNVLDKCTDLEGSEGNSKAQRVIADVCTLVNTSLLSGEDRSLISKVQQLPEILAVLKESQDLTKNTKKALDTTSGQLKETNKALEANKGLIKGNNAALGTTNTELTKTNTALGTTNRALDNANDKLEKTKAELEQANEALGMTNTELTKTNTALGTTNSRLEKTNEALDNTNKRLIHINNDALDKPKKGDETKSDGELTNKGAEATDKPKAPLDETEPSNGKSETSK